MTRKIFITEETGIINVGTLYKYRAWNDDMNYQKRIITNNEIYLSSADQFNDPFDASLPFSIDQKGTKKK